MTLDGVHPPKARAAEARSAGPHTVGPRAAGRLGAKDEAGPGGDRVALIARVLRRTVPPHRGRFAIAYLCIVVSAGATGAIAWLVGSLAEQVFIGGDRSALAGLGALVMGAFALRGIADFNQGVIVARAGNAIMAAEQHAAFAHLTLAGLDELQRFGSARIVTRVTQGTNAMALVGLMVAQSAVRDLLSILALSLVVVLQVPVTALAFLIAVPLLLAGASMLQRRIRGMVRRSIGAQADIVAALQDTVRGIEVVRAFGIEGAMRERAGRAIDNLRARTDAMARLQAAASPLTELTGGLVFGGIVVWIGLTAAAGPAPIMALGASASMLTAMLLLYEPVRRLTRLSVQLEPSLGAVRMLFDLLDRPLGATERQDLPDLAIGPGAIRFESVSHRYGDGTRALHELDLAVRAGSFVALVGASGAGKSTLLRLIMRLHEVESGRILIDGADIARHSASSLRASIAHVGQDCFLFRGTVAENIALGLPGADEAAVREAARRAGVLEFEDALALGLATPVGEGGARLSGGQRQRVAIARAFLKDAPILLLDEVTAALDAHAEARVLDAIRDLADGRTVVVAAHRLSIARGADMIVVMEAGRVVETGTHKGLLREGRRYAALHAAQAA